MQFWAVLRFDNLKWVNVKSMSMTARGLSFMLDRTKVTGPGKKVTHLYCYISARAYFSEPDWLGRVPAGKDTALFKQNTNHVLEGLNFAVGLCDVVRVLGEQT